MGEGKSLLDCLHNLLGCEYLSDMGLDGRRNYAAKLLLGKIGIEGYPVKEWNDTLQYLYGVNKLFCSSEEIAQWLQENEVIYQGQSITY